MAPAIDFLAVQSTQSIVPNGLEYTIEAGLVVASVVNKWIFVRYKFSRRIRKLVLPDQVDATKFGWVDTEIVRGHVHQPLAKEVGFKTTWSAIRADGCFIRNEDGNVEFERSNSIWPDQKLGRANRNDTAIGTGIGTHVAVDGPAKSQDETFTRTRDLQIASDLPRMVGCHQVLAAVLDPLDGSSDFLGDEWHKKIFRIKFSANAEASSDIGAHHMNLVHFQPQRFRCCLAVEPENFRGTPDLHSAVGLVP